MYDEFENELTSNLTRPASGQIVFVVFEDSRKSGRRELLITEDEAIAIEMIQGYDIPYVKYFRERKLNNSNISLRWYERYKYSESSWSHHLTAEEIKEIMKDDESEREEHLRLLKLNL